MKEKNGNKRKYLENFNPDVCELSKCEHQDFLFSNFNAGNSFQQFNEFLIKEAIEYAEEGNGVTYIVFNQEFDIQICGIPSIEIKMFAVDERYQDLFYVYEDEEFPIAAWIIKSIIHEAQKMLVYTIGFKAVFLHSMPNAKDFYEKNGFHTVKSNMHPLHSIDSDLEPMYLTLRNIVMHYDK